MSLRTAAIEVSLQRLNILRIEHPQANPLRLACILRAGETLPSGLTLTAEIHTSRNVAAETAPLASTTVSVGAGALTFDVDFTSSQLNQTVTPDSTRALWLVLYGVGDADQLYTLATADLLLGWHAISRLTASPPATAILIEKGGVAWATGRTYASGTVVTVGTTAYVATSAHTSGSTTQPGTGASWATVWAVLSGGGGGGGTVTAVSVATANGVSGTSSGGATPALTLTLGAITPTSVNGVTFTNGGSGALTVTGTASVAGTSSGTNTGNVTLAAELSSIMTLAGQQLGAVTDPGADRIVFFDQSANAWGYLIAGTGLSISGTTISVTSTGDVTGPASSTANAIARFSGTGGKTLLNSAIVIDDATTSTQANVTIANVHSETNSAIVLTPKGTGAFIVGPKPDGTTTGGNLRGARAIDLQSSRASNSQVASNTDSFVCGANNTASGTRAGVFSGESNTASASQSACLAGQVNTASATQAVTLGGTSAVANRIGMQASANGAFSSNGDAQAGRVVMRRQTTDATPVQLSIGGSAPTGSSITTSTHFILLNNQAVFADIRVVARSTSGTDHAAYMRRVLIKRDGTIASTAIIGSVLSPTADIESAGATAWDVSITAENSSVGALLITVTGAASTTINWTAEVSFVETIRA
jgi:hypothetical protein